MILTIFYKITSVLFAVLLAGFSVMTAELIAICLKEVVHGVKILTKTDILTLIVLASLALSEIILVSMLLGSVIGIGVLYVFIGIVTAIVVLNIPFVLG